MCLVPGIYWCVVLVGVLTLKSFKDWGGECLKFVPVLGGDGTKIVPPRYLFDQPPGEMSGIRGKFAGHVGGHLCFGDLHGDTIIVVCPPQSLNDSLR